MWASSTSALIHEALLAEGFNLIQSHTAYPLYAGRLKLKSDAVECEIHFRDLDFLELPKLKILDPRLREKSVAHFDDSGFYCYVHPDENIINKYDQRGAVRSSLDMMIAALTNHLERDLSGEIAQEFPAHWFGDESATAELGKRGDRLIKVRFVGNDAGTFPVLTESDAISSCIGTFERTTGGEPLARLVEFSGSLTFFNGQRQPDTLAELTAWGNSQGQSLGDRVAQGFGYLGSELIEMVFIRAANGTVGARIDVSALPQQLFARPAGFARMLHHLQKRVRIKRIRTKLVSKELIFKRSLADKSMNLAQQKIAVIGCGTIGSHLAKILAQSGAGEEGGQLTLIDDQNLEAENVGRHFLGTNRIGQNKAKACEAEIKRLLPDCAVRGIKADAREVLGSISTYDLLIDATGEERLSVVINEWLWGQHKAGNGLTGIFVYLFGNALAAQAILVRGDEYACYRCLKPRHGEGWRYEPRREPASIEIVPGNCGESPYLPYGVGGSVIAAGLASNMALDWVNGNYSPRLRTMRINFERTRAVNDVNPARSSACPLCKDAGVG